MRQPVRAGTPSAMLSLLPVALLVLPLVPVLFPGRSAAALGHPHPDKAFAVHPDHGEKELHRTIGALEDQWHAAMLANDVATVDRLLADDYVGIGPDGTIASKADELAARRSGERKLTQLDVVERKIRIYGPTAVVTSRAIVSGMYDTMPLNGEFRYTRVYNLSHGQWRIVSFEASPITAGRKQR